MTSVKESEFLIKHKGIIQILFLPLMLALLFLGMCMKRANGLVTANSLMLSSGWLYMALMNEGLLQQASQPPSPSVTASGVLSSTMTITLSPSQTSASLSQTPSATVSPTLSPIPSFTLTPAPTGTPFMSTDTPVVMPTEESPPPFPYQTAPQTITATSTWIPFPTVSLIIPTFTPTPRLLFLDNSDSRNNLNKGQTSNFNASGGVLLILLLGLLWVGLFVWFVVAQVFTRHEES